MAQDGRQGAFDVVGDEVAAVFEGCYGLGDAHEADGGAGAGSEGECGPVAGTADEGEDVGEQLWLDADGADFAAGGGEQTGRDGLDGCGVE